MKSETCETWLPVVGYEGLYSVSNRGRVLGPRGWILNPTREKDGKLRVGLRKDGLRRTCLVHRLVLEAFDGPCPEGMEGCHENDIPDDNRWPENLRWDTRGENLRDRTRNGIHHMANRTHCPQRHPYDEENTYRTRDGRRMCRTCLRDRKKAA